MRTIMVMRWDGVTPDQYDQVKKLVNWEADAPVGGVFHVTGFSNNVLRITDIWESEDDFNNFVQNRLMPAVAQTDIKGEPQVETFPVHDIYVPDMQRLT